MQQVVRQMSSAVLIAAACSELPRVNPVYRLLLRSAQLQSADGRTRMWRCNSPRVLMLCLIFNYACMHII